METLLTTVQCYMNKQACVQYLTLEMNSAKVIYEFICTVLITNKYCVYSYRGLRPAPVTCRTRCDSSHQVKKVSVAADIRLQLTTHLETSERRKTELAQLAGLQRMVYPHKWSPISCRPSAGQRKHASQGPTLYYWTTQPRIQVTFYDDFNAQWLKQRVSATISTLWGQRRDSSPFRRSNPPKPSFLGHEQAFSSQTHNY